MTSLMEVLGGVSGNNCYESDFLHQIKESIQSEQACTVRILNYRLILNYNLIYECIICSILIKTKLLTAVSQEK